MVLNLVGVQFTQVRVWELPLLTFQEQSPKPPPIAWKQGDLPTYDKTSSSSSSSSSLDDDEKHIEM